MSYNTSNSSIVSVQNFGARGDGISDDTVAIQLCFSTAKRGDTILFPKGTYLITSYINLSKDYLTILGDDATITSNLTGQDRKFNVSNRSNIVFRNLKFNGGNLTALPQAPAFDTYTPNNSPGTIHFEACINCSVENCNFTGLNWPITILGACYNVKIFNNTFSSYYTAIYGYWQTTPSFGFTINPICQGFYSAGATYNQGDYIMWVTPEANFNGTPYFYICKQNGVTGLSNSPTNNPSLWIGTFFEPRNTDVSPQRIFISNNNFYQGLWQCWIYPARYFGRYYPATSVFCSGAIKFRGAANQTLNTYQGLVISNNIIQGSGQMGIELQTTYNATVTSNTIENVDIGISLSYAQRITVSNNSIKNINYAGIECDGNTGGDSSASSDENVISNNNIDGRDDYGSPANFVDNNGIVISNSSIHILVSNNVTKYLKTGIKIISSSGKINLVGNYIITNEESGTGGSGGYLPYMMPYVQGILIQSSSNVSIVGNKCEPTLQAWQRMINIDTSNNISIKSSEIISNNTPIYAKNTFNLEVDSCILKIGDFPGFSGAGNEPRFLCIDSTNATCSGINIRNNIFRGTGARMGIHLYCPFNSIRNLDLSNNSSSEANTVISPFIFREGTGITGLNIINHYSGSCIGIGMLPNNQLNIALSGSIGLFGIQTSSSANIGGVTVPSTAAGFVTINITGTNFKFPYYNV